MLTWLKGKGASCPNLPAAYFKSFDMPKEIILVRHGKAITPDSFTRDIDRVLTERGINDGYKIGERLIAEGVNPDIVLTSPAARASHTAFIISRVLNIDTDKINIVRNLFHCSEDIFLDEIFSLDNDLDSVLISAHNPGITDLAYDLTRGGTSFLPTTGVALIRFNVSKWTEISSAKPDFTLILKPKEI